MLALAGAIVAVLARAPGAPEQPIQTTVSVETQLTLGVLLVLHRDAETVVLPSVQRSSVEAVTAGALIRAEDPQAVVDRL